MQPSNHVIALNIRSKFKTLKGVVNELEKFTALTTDLEPKLSQGWIEHDFASLRRRFVGNGGSLFSIFNKEYRAAKAELIGFSGDGFPKKYKDRVGLLDRICEATTLRSEIRSLDGALAQELSDIWEAEKTDLDAIKQISSWFEASSSLNQDQFLIACGLIRNPEITSSVSALPRLLDRYRELTGSVLQHAQMEDGSIAVENIRVTETAINEWRRSLSRFNEWPGVRNKLAEMRPVIGDSFAQLIYDGSIELEKICPLFKISVLETIWNSLVERNPELASLDGYRLNETLQEFRRLDQERHTIASAEVLSNYAQKKPTGVYGDMAVIKQEINKKRGHLPVRKLLTKAGKAIQELKPVFLMSPMSIAQYLAPGNLMFDMVIIDEASQVRPEDALGAIARAKQVVVVGDDKQLPPTNFFNRLSDESQVEEDEDGIALSNLESILSLANVILPNQCMLRWHYRSHHPGLIAVSNRNFYKNELLLPPSVIRQSYSDGMGVSFVRSPPNGYTRGGSNGGRNVLEAELIAAAVIEFAREFPDKSLGVAAFSVQQRDAIRDLVDNERRKHPELDGFFSPTHEEHFFIKNLESIQGDQRDVIFISVGYGRDQHGRLTQNFGPLGRDGGERRLNVLISRAKDRCTVFSSITADDIVPAPGKLGINAFREFLRYAEKGYFDVPETAERDFDSDFEESVALFLRTHGYEIQPQVGMAGFYIDIGVVNPKNSNMFLCGIECDGATYHSSRSARDRDRLRQSILESRGWQIYRIWSTDWFHRRTEQEAKLLDYLSEAEKNAFSIKGKERKTQKTTPPPEHSSSNTATNTEAITPAPSLSTPYQEYSTTYNSSQQPHEITRHEMSLLVKKIVALESPIHEDEVGRRVAKCFGLNRAGSRIQNAAKIGLGIAGLKRKNGFWSSPESNSIQVRDRSRVESRSLLSAEYLPPDEIEEALVAVVMQNIRIHQDELIQQTSRMFGFLRCGPDLAVAISKTLNSCERLQRDPVSQMVELSRG